MREADRAVDLMRDLGAAAGGLADAHLGHRDGERGAAVVGVDRRGGGIGGGLSGGGLAGEHRELLLHRLELSDRASELDALARVLDGDRQDVLRARRS